MVSKEATTAFLSSTVEPINGDFENLSLLTCGDKDFVVSGNNDASGITPSFVEDKLPDKVEKDYMPWNTKKKDYAHLNSCDNDAERKESPTNAKTNVNNSTLSLYIKQLEDEEFSRMRLLYPMMNFNFGKFYVNELKAIEVLIYVFEKFGLNGDLPFINLTLDDVSKLKKSSVIRQKLIKKHKLYGDLVVKRFKSFKHRLLYPEFIKKEAASIKTFRFAVQNAAIVEYLASIYDSTSAINNLQTYTVFVECLKELSSLDDDKDGLSEDSVECARNSPTQDSPLRRQISPISLIEDQPASLPPTNLETPLPSYKPYPGKFCYAKRYFKHEEDEKGQNFALCQIQKKGKPCGARLKMQDSGTKTLWTHLQSHPEVYNSASKFKRNAKPGPSADEPPKKQSHLNPVTTTKPTVQKACDLEVLTFIAQSNSAFLIIENKILKGLFELKHRGAYVYGRNYYSRNALPKIIDEKLIQVKNMLKDKYYSSTSDGWTSKSRNVALESLTLHYLNEKFERQNLPIGAIPLYGSHTAEVIAAGITQMFQRAQISTEKLVMMVRDNGSNIKKACEDMNFPSFQCGAHFLHLVVCSALDLKDIDEIVSKVKKIVAALRRSSILQKELKELQKKHNLPPNKLPLACKTRWNSTYHMLETFIENESAIKKLSHESVGKMAISDFDVIKGLLSVLKQFDIETKKLCSSDSVCSEIIPVMKILMKLCKAKSERSGIPLVSLFSKTLMESIKARLPKMNNIPFMEETMCIDPRFARDDRFLTAAEWDLAERRIIAKVVASHDAVVQAEIRNEEHNSDSFDEENPWSSAKREKRVTTADSHEAIQQAVKAEFDLIQHLRVDSDDLHPAGFFFKHQKKLLYLVGQAPIYLSVPSTSVDSERFFSKPTMLYANDLRNSLSAEVAQDILLLKGLYQIEDEGGQNKIEQIEEDDDYVRIE